MTTTNPDALELNRAILDEITGKWTLLVLDALCHGPLRFNALRRAQPGVTQRALTQCLRRLEASGFVRRDVISTAPVAVAYEITPLGRSLEPHLRGLLAWAEDHRDAVLQAQAAFAASSPDRQSPQSRTSTRR